MRPPEILHLQLSQEHLRVSFLRPQPVQGHGIGITSPWDTRLYFLPMLVHTYQWALQTGVLEGKGVLSMSGSGGPG